MKPSVILAIALIWFSNAYAFEDDEEFIYGDFTFTVLSAATKTAELSDYKGNETEIEIPSEVAGFSITSIGRGAFRDHTPYVTKVTLPNTITTIRAAAFSGCNLLSSINIPNSVTKIESTAFGYCNHLASIEFPESLKEIQQGAFVYCSSLETITLPKSVEILASGAFALCNKLTSISVEEGNINYCSVDGAVYNFDKNTLIMCPTGLNYFEIPEFVDRIYEYAFYGCGNLKTVAIPTSVKTIDGYSFVQCQGLESIEIPNSITEIGEGTFQLCKNLKRVVLPSSIQSIGNYALCQCGNLSDIYSYSNIPPVVDEFTFAESHKATVHVPEGSLESYRNAEGWNYFFDFIPIDPNSVTAIRDHSTTEEYFDLQGNKVTNLKKGEIYIERKCSETRKLILK